VSDTERTTTSADRAKPTLDDERIRTGLDHEHRLVSEAILLVSSGGSPRVTVAGLHYPEQILEASRAFAATRQVRLVPLWTDDEHGADIAVEAVAEDDR
jgi:hypothetical protein